MMERWRARWDSLSRSSFLGRGLIRKETDPLPPWKNLLSQDRDLWAHARQRAASGPKILIANNVPAFYNSTILESLLAVALTLRGADVHLLLCDEVMPACFNTKFRRTTPESFFDGTFRTLACPPCVERRRAFTDLKLPTHYYSQYLNAQEIAAIRRDVDAVKVSDIPGYVWEGFQLGEHAHAGALRYFSTATLEGQPLADGIARKYLEAALQSARVVKAVLKAHSFDAACFHHGIYVPQGIVGEVCRAQGVRVATWNVAYRKRCFLFSHHDTYHHTLLEEPVSAWKDMRFTDEHEREIERYLKTRWSGSQDWVYFHDTPDERDQTLVRETGIDLTKPIVGLLTNVMWDAQLHYRANAFPSMLDWILKTIRYFEGRPDVQLLIRIHPAELRGLQPSRQFVVDEIRKVFPSLPANVFVIPPESQINTYAAMMKCNAVVIYGTKTGVELTSMGIPVLVAGEAWIRNKGLTTDVSSEADYYRALDRFPLRESRLSPELVREARKYAFHFFMRRMIPLQSVAETQDKGAPFRVAIDSLKDLLPGNDPGLDVICDGILSGSPFIFRAEDVSSPAILGAARG